jgi:hypothetical protein
MKKYIVLYTAPIEATEQMQQVPPEEQAKGMEAWMQWAQKCGDKLVDLGSPLAGGQKLSPSGSTNSNLNLAGYSILQANSMEEAKGLLKGHPHLGWNAACTIEVYETMPLPGM